MIGFLALANCEWGFEETRNYVRERKAFGKTISNLPVSWAIAVTTFHVISQTRIGLPLGS